VRLEWLKSQWREREETKLAIGKKIRKRENFAPYFFFLRP
jgi:hypothetical protein